MDFVKPYNITKPAAWTPTITGMGTVTNLVANYWRVGRFLRGELYWQNGTVTGDKVSITLPNSLNVDTAIVSRNNANTAEGQTWGFWGGEGASRSGHVLTAPASSTQVVYLGNRVDTSNALVPAVGTGIAGNSVKHSCFFEVPIAEWTSA